MRLLQITFLICWHVGITYATPIISQNWQCSIVNENNEISKQTSAVRQCAVNVTSSIGALATCNVSLLDSSLVRETTLSTLNSLSCLDGNTKSVVVNSGAKDAYESCLKACVVETDFECRSTKIDTLLSDRAYRCTLSDCYFGESIANLTYSDERKPAALLDKNNTEVATRSFWLTDPVLCYGSFLTFPPTPNFVQIGYIDGFDKPIQDVWLGRENLLAQTESMTVQECAAYCRSYLGITKCKAFTFEASLDSPNACFFFDAYAAHFQEDKLYSTLYLPRFVFADPEAVIEKQKVYMDSSIVPSDVYVIKTESIQTVIQLETIAVGHRTFAMFMTLATALTVAMIFNCMYIDFLFI